MRFRLSVLVLAVSALGLADTLTLRNGQVLNGDYVGGDARHVKFAVGDRVDTYSIDDVESLRFRLGDRLTSHDWLHPATTLAIRAPPPPPPAERSGFAQQSQPPPSPVAGIQIPSGSSDHCPHDRSRGFRKDQPRRDLSCQRR